jgi:hypothetical protein
MKSIFLFLLSFCFATGLTAQNCEGFYYLNNKAVIVMTSFDKKTEATGKSVYTINNVTKSGSTTIGDYSYDVFDQKGKTVSSGTGKYKCTGGVMLIDAKAALPSENMSAYKDMDVKADEVFIEYPVNMNAGQSLNDVDFVMSVMNNNIKFADVSLTQLNRKVEGKESVTSPAGTWECWKITFDGRFRAGIGPIGIPFNFKGIEWYVPGFGVVKTETYLKNGKLAGSTLITEIKK